ncbi:MAG: hypothetical protein EOQ98_31860 [Mesorhizobium sp.]|uniref:hypothetical protein n=1 Tax=Mesorhizobium sp. TaxID=1871066 RepID=UPI000FE67D85|nr:hypothetical protein [Mesorhizobium sp.]RWO94198.1 MAG: hypothetical protein EOQ98_31860 [Mesorhizobium sp.]
MSYDWLDAERDRAYEELVEEIISDNKHLIISEFALERLRSFYLEHPDLSEPATSVLAEAKALLPVSPSAALVFAFVCIEITLRDVLARPVAVGLVHDGTMGELVAELVVSNRHFHKLLFHILNEAGHVPLDVLRRTKKSTNIWAEKEALRAKRDQVVHRGAKATTEEADVAIWIAAFLLEKVYPGLKNYYGA